MRVLDSNFGMKELDRLLAQNALWECLNAYKNIENRLEAAHKIVQLLAENYGIWLLDRSALRAEIRKLDAKIVELEKVRMDGLFIVEKRDKQIKELEGCLDNQQKLHQEIGELKAVNKILQATNQTHSENFVSVSDLQGTIKDRDEAIDILENKLNRISELVATGISSTRENHYATYESYSEKQIKNLLKDLKTKDERADKLSRELTKEKYKPRLTEAMVEMAVANATSAARGMFWVVDNNKIWKNKGGLRWLVMTPNTNVVTQQMQKNSCLGKFVEKEEAENFCEWKRVEYVRNFEIRFRAASTGSTEAVG